MAEPRARPARNLGQLNFEEEIRQLLNACGDSKDPLPEVVRVVDAIVTDFQIEMHHNSQFRAKEQEQHA